MTRLERITPTLFDDFRAARRGFIQPRTLFHESMVIKQLLNWDVGRNLLQKNPLDVVELHKPIESQRSAPTMEQLKLIYGTVSDRDQVLLATLACTGMRSGEIRQLRVEDVDLDGRWFHIVSRADARTKTRTSRKVPIHPVLLPLLKRIPKRATGWFFTAEPSSKYPEGDHWVSTKKLNDRFVARLRKLRLPAGRSDGGFTIHSLRHFMETHAINSGIPQRVVDVWLGHRPDRSMGALYYHLSDEDSQRLMHKLTFSL